MAVVATGEMVVTPNLAGFESKLSGSMGRIASSAGRALSTGITAAAAVGAATVTAALVKGFGRLTTIEDSTRALTLTLGDAAKAGALLGEVLTVVKGTPFALDQFAAGAQQLVGFGVQAEKVPGILRAVGDASATQGKRAGEFAGRLIEVFGQIAAKGRIQLEDVWRISETGVNALQILGNSFGLTTTAMQALISEGAVPAGEAMDALVKGITDGSDGVNGATRKLGGLAQTLGTTLSGSLANFRIAFVRAGANILAPFSGLLTKLLQKGITVIDAVGGALAKRAAEFASKFDSAKFFAFLDSVPGKLRPVLDGIRDMGAFLGPIAGLLAGIASTGLAGALGPLGALIPTLSPLLGLVLGLVASSPELRDAMVELGRALVPVAESLGVILIAAAPFIAMLAGVAANLIEVIAGIVTWADKMNILTPILAAAAIAFGVMWLAALGPVTLVIIGLSAVAAGLVTMYKESETFRRIADNAFAIVKADIEAVVHAIEAMVRALQRAWDVANKLARALNNLPGAGAAKKGLSSLIPGLGLLPGFAHGGVVPGLPGAPQLIVAHGGEQVLTAAQRRGGGAYFGPGSVVVTFAGALPTDAQAYTAGQAVGRGAAYEMERAEARRAARVA